MVRKWTEALPAKTGRSLDEWLELVKASRVRDEKECRAWLKDVHELPTNTAYRIAERSHGKGADMASPEAYLKAAEGYVDALFAGGKAPLRPIYDELLMLCLSLGPDAKACPCQTMVPLYRKHVFAQIKPATARRIDLGLALGGRLATGRLIDTGGYAKKDRITHRIAISAAAEIDGEVRQWLQTAYEEDR
jgi:hypothetical protein